MTLTELLGKIILCVVIVMILCMFGQASHGVLVDRWCGFAMMTHSLARGLIGQLGFCGEHSCGLQGSQHETAVVGQSAPVVRVLSAVSLSTAAPFRPNLPLIHRFRIFSALHEAFPSRSCWCPRGHVMVHISYDDAYQSCRLGCTIKIIVTRGSDI